MILLRAAILLFVPGILKCLEKPWALKNATVASIMNSSDSRLEATLESLDDDAQQKEKDINSQEKYVQAAAKSVANPGTQPVELFEDDLADLPYHLFVDRGHPYSIRLRNLRLVAPRSARAADVHDLVRSSLSKAFDRLYTKHKASFGGLLRAAVALVTFVVIGLFQRTHRGVYDRSGVVVTYVLLGCTAALEFVSACLVLASGLLRPDDKLAQYNLIGYLARNEKHPWFWALARLLGARGLLDRLWCTAPPQPSRGVTTLVYDHVARGWKDYIGKSECNAAAAVRDYRLFNDSRGRRTLQWEGCAIKERQQTLETEGCRVRIPKAIEKSLRRPFDESVLLWHLATEFCYFDHVDTGHDATRHSRMMSNYMAYLLFVKPEMLIPGARCRLFRATYLELRKILKPPPEDELAEAELEPTGKKARPPRSENEMVRKVIQKVKSTIGLGPLGSENVVHKAWAVANELKEFAKEKKKELNDDLKESNEKMKNLKMAMDSAKEKADKLLLEGKDISIMQEVENAKKNAEEFIQLEKKNKLTKEEERLTQLVESAKNKAEEYINMENKKKQTKEENNSEKDETKAEKSTKNEQENAEVKMSSKATEEEKEKKMVKDFSNSAQAVINEIDKKDKQLKDLVERNLITDEEELLMIRARELAVDKMWAVIQGVWVEMLCFSAGRCRGYLHAKSLANGGEYLSNVWLLLSYMGMETMPERVQRPEPPAVGDETMLERMERPKPPGVGDKTMPERMERPELPVVGDTGALVRTPTDEDMEDLVGEQNV